jgi:hypothetical protein
VTRERKSLIAEWAPAADPDPKRERAALRGIATEEEVSAALGTPWPSHEWSGPRPESDPFERLFRAYLAAKEAGGVLHIRGNPFRDEGIKGFQKTRAFTDAALRLYDLLASRIPPRRRTLAWDKGPVACRFNMRAAKLTADILNTLPCWCDPPITADDIKSRVQKRGRR